MDVVTATCLAILGFSNLFPSVIRWEIKAANVIGGRETKITRATIAVNQGVALLILVLGLVYLTMRATGVIG